MGVTGLLPLLKQATKDVHATQLSGQTAAVDMYAWIHSGICGCAQALFDGKDVDTYVDYCIRGLDVLVECGIKPYCVFDGRDLPSKLAVEEERQERRKQTRKEIEGMIARGEKGYFFKMAACIDVTPYMARKVIRAVKERGFDYVVAPHEADAQMAYLAKEGIVDFVISEDSDLVVFGVQKILFKFKRDTCRGQLFDATKISKCLGNQFKDFERFRNFCILAGCDYIKNLPGIGITRALNFFKMTECPDLRRALKRIYSYLKIKTNESVSDEYIDEFMKAINTFKHQLVFCPKRQKFVPLTPYEDGLTHLDFPYAGEMLDDEMAIKLSQGLIDLDTLQPVELIATDSGDTGSTTVSGSSQSSTSSYFNYEARKKRKSEEDGILVKSSKQKTEAPKKNTNKEVTIEFNGTPIAKRKVSSKSVFKQSLQSQSSEGTPVISKYFVSEVNQDLVDQYKVKQKMEEVEQEVIERRSQRAHSQSTRSSQSASQRSFDSDATPSTLPSSYGSQSQEISSQELAERDSNVERIYAARTRSQSQSSQAKSSSNGRKNTNGNETPSDISSESDEEEEEVKLPVNGRAKVRV